MYKGVPLMEGMRKEDIDKWLDEATFTSSDSKTSRSVCAQPLFADAVLA